MNGGSIAVNRIGPACTKFQVVARIIYCVCNVRFICAKAQCTTMFRGIAHKTTTRVTFNFTYNIRQTCAEKCENCRKSEMKNSKWKEMNLYGR